MMGVLIALDALMISLIRGTPRVICNSWSQGLYTIKTFTTEGYVILRAIECIN